MKILVDQTNLDLLTIPETHLTEAVLDNEICIAGYQLLRRYHRGKAGGGVAIYCKDEIVCSLISMMFPIFKPSGLKSAHSSSDCLLVLCTDLLTLLISLTNFAVVRK